SMKTRFSAFLAATLLALTAAVAVAPASAQESASAAASAAAPAPAAEAASAPAAPVADAGAPAAPAAAKEVVENPYGLDALWKTGDFVAKGTLIIMVIMSMGSWYILITKIIDQVK
ncbi:MotA/TolQ/ExbB proton channel family protein, partial [Undibacterium sp. Di27W]